MKSSHPNSEARLLMLQTRPPRLRSSALDGSDLRILIEDLGATPDGICVDVARGHIYWTNMGPDWNAPDGTIERCDLDGSNRKLLVGGGSVVTPKQLTLADDWMYWCDREGMRVMRSRMDGTNIEVLVRTGRGAEDKCDERLHCVGVAVDLEEQYIYWTQKGPPKGDQGRIFRAPLALPVGASPDDRRDIETLLQHLPEPIDLEIDPESRMLYWTDRGGPPDGNSLNRARIGSTGLQSPEVLMRGLDEGIGLALDRKEQAVFVSELGGRIHSYDLKTRTARLAFQHGRTTGIALVRTGE
jgi:hypothetical protein